MVLSAAISRQDQTYIQMRAIRSVGFVYRKVLWCTEAASSSVWYRKLRCKYGMRNNGVFLPLEWSNRWVYHLPCISMLFLLGPHKIIRRLGVLVTVRGWPDYRKSSAICMEMILPTLAVISSLLILWDFNPAQMSESSTAIFAQCTCWWSFVLWGGKNLYFSQTWSEGLRRSKETGN